MKIYIKYMVSIRCKMVVKAALDELGLRYGLVELGEVDVIDCISDEQHEQLKIVLLKSGLELMDSKKALLIEKIKNVIIEMVHYTDELPRTRHAVFISEKLNLDYTYLAALFSEVAGITIENYLIIQKIERVKELLIYEDLALTEISYKLNYMSVAQLSGQFKRVTGLTTTFFKKLKQNKRSTAKIDMNTPDSDN